MANYDVVIVGNGAVGYALAHALNMTQTNLKIAVVGEAHRPYCASSAAGAMLGEFGEVTAFGRKSKIFRSKMEAGRVASQMWEGWVQSINDEVAAESRLRIRNGTFVILNAVGGYLDSDNFLAITEHLDEADHPYEEVDPRGIPGFEPWEQARALRAIYIPGENSLDSDRLLAAYDEMFGRSPLVDLIHDHVVGLKVTQSSVQGVTLRNGDELLAPRVVLAAGVGTQDILDKVPDIGRRIPRIFSGGGSSIVIDPEWVFKGAAATRMEHVIRTPNRSLACGLHAIPRGDSHIYVGATNLVSLDPWEKFSNLSDLQFLMECAVEQINQDLIWSQVRHIQTGNRPVALDECPLIGRTSADGLWVLTGTFRDGLFMSPAFARDVSREITEGVSATDPLFRPERMPIAEFSAAEIVEELKLHHQAALLEHRAVNSTKSGMHLGMPVWLHHYFSRIYECMDCDDFALPASFSSTFSDDPEECAKPFTKWYQVLKQAHGA